MNYFTPIFSSIVDSSLWMEPDYVSKAFITLLALKDSSHHVDINAFRLGRRCWPMEKPVESERKAMEALKILSAPDRLRNEPQPFEGRRIEKTEHGYLILNGQYYEDLMREVSRRAYKARKEREYREIDRKFSGTKKPQRKPKADPHRVTLGELNITPEEAARRAEQNGDSEFPG